MRARFALVLAISVCCSFTPLHAATSSRTVVVQLEVDSHRPTYRLHSPPALHKPKATAAKMPLVVVLHGAGATGREVERRYRWDPLADREQFVVAYPQAIAFRWDDSGTADVDFLGALLDDASRRFPKDSPTGGGPTPAPTT